MAETLNKILGAIALCNQDGAVTRISSDILVSGDCCLCITQTTYYIFKAYESNATVTPETQNGYSEKNPPLILKPEDNPTTAWRWHLISPSVFLTDLTLPVGKTLTVSKIQGQPNVQFLNADNTLVAELRADGTFWVNKLAIADNSVVSNLHAEFIGDIPASNVMTRDGSKTFSAPVVGQEPTLPDHLATKNYVDEKVQILHPELYIRRDGSNSFEAPVSGFDPNLDDHLVTKRYVDRTLETAINDMLSAQNFIIYKCGVNAIPVGSRRVQVTFGGVLKSYVVFATLVNTSEAEPYSTTAVISEQYQTYFTADLGGIIPTASYKLNWMIVGMPLLPDFEYNTTDGVDPGVSNIPILPGGGGKIVLKDNMNVYISNLGNDGNDGFTASSAKLTHAGLLSLLNSITPNGYIVTVNVSGVIDGDALWFLPEYYPENLIFKNINPNVVDGFSGHVYVCSGGLQVKDIQIKKLSIRNDATVEIVNNIKVKNTSNDPAFSVSGLLQFTGSNIIYEGTFNRLFDIVKGQVFAKNCIFSSTNAKLTNFAWISGPNASLHFENTATYSGTVTISGKSIVLDQGGMVYGLTSTCPGGGTINATNPFMVNEVPIKWSHNTQHFSDGSDPITPANIGALAVDGVAVAATKLKNSQSIIINGSVYGTGSFDGASGPCIINTTVNTTDATISGLLTHVITTVDVHGALSTATTNTIIIRDGYARAQIADPVDDADIANKKYVDFKINDGVAKLSTPRNITLGNDLKGFAAFDGSANIIINASLTGNTIGTFARSVGSQAVAYEFICQIYYIVDNTTDLNTCKTNVTTNNSLIFNIEDSIVWQRISGVWYNVGTNINDYIPIGVIISNSVTKKLFFRNTTNIWRLTN